MQKNPRIRGSICLGSSMNSSVRSPLSPRPPFTVRCAPEQVLYTAAELKNCKLKLLKHTHFELPLANVWIWGKVLSMRYHALSFSGTLQTCARFFLQMERPLYSCCIRGPVGKRHTTWNLSHFNSSYFIGFYWKVFLVNRCYLEQVVTSAIVE